MLLPHLPLQRARVTIDPREEPSLHTPGFGTRCRELQWLLHLGGLVHLALTSPPEVDNEVSQGLRNTQQSHWEPSLNLAAPSSKWSSCASGACPK